MAAIHDSGNCFGEKNTKKEREDTKPHALQTTHCTLINGT